MGRNQELKKQRQYARREARQVYSKFLEDFKAKDIMKPCPRFIPNFVWNLLINILVKK